METCTTCGGFLAVESPRFGFFVSGCDSCGHSACGFISIADAIEQAESLMER